MTLLQDIAEVAALLYPDALTSVTPAYPEILIGIVPKAFWREIQLLSQRTALITCDDSSWNAPTISTGGNKVIAFLPLDTNDDTFCYLSLATHIHLSGTLPDNYTVTYSQNPLSLRKNNNEKDSL